VIPSSPVAVVIPSSPVAVVKTPGKLGRHQLSRLLNCPMRGVSHVLVLAHRSTHSSLEVDHSIPPHAAVAGLHDVAGTVVWK
jgi:hypothetical protein